MPDPAVENLNS